MSAHPRLILLALIATVLSIPGASRASSAEGEAGGTPEEILASKGLKRVERRYLLDEESSVGDTFRAAQPTFAQYHAVEDQIVSVVQSQQALDRATMARQDLQAMNEQINFELDQGPKRGGPRQNQFNSLQMQAHQQVQTNRQQILALERDITQLRRSIPPPPAQRKLTGEYEKLRKGCLERLTVLDAAVYPVQEKYRELAQDKEVTNALAAASRKAKVSLRLGPSDQFVAAVNLIRAEKRAMSPVASRPAAKQPKAKKKGRAR